MSIRIGRMGRMWPVVVGLMVGVHAGETADSKTQAAEGAGTTTAVGAKVAGAKQIAAAKDEASAEQRKRREGEAKRINARVKRLERKAEAAAKAREAVKNPPKQETVFISNELSPSEKDRIAPESTAK